MWASNGGQRALQKEATHPPLGIGVPWWALGRRQRGQVGWWVWAVGCSQGWVGPAPPPWVVLPASPLSLLTLYSPVASVSDSPIPSLAYTVIASHSLNKCLLGAHGVPSTLPGTGV